MRPLPAYFKFSFRFRRMSLACHIGAHSERTE